MTNNTNNKKRRILYTTPVTIDQRAVKASERVFGAPLREKENIKRPTRKRK